MKRVLFPLRKRREYTVSKFTSQSHIISPVSVPIPAKIDSFNGVESSETVLVTEKITILEGKKFVLRLPAGTVYSSCTVSTFDCIIDLLEDCTGLSLISRTYPEKLHVGVFDVGNYFKDQDYAGFYNGAKIAIRGKDLFIRKCDYTMWAMFGGMVFTHEAAHAISDRGTNACYRGHGGLDNMPAPIAEGFATFMDGLISKKLGIACGVTFSNAGKTTADMIVHDYLDVFLSADVFRNNEYKIYAYSLGCLIFSYIHEQFGMNGVRNTLLSTANVPMHQATKSISSALGTDILAEFPQWYDSNAVKYIHDEKQAKAALKNVASLTGNRYDAIPFLSYMKDNPRFHFDFSGESNCPILIDFRKGFETAYRLGYLHFKTVSFDLCITRDVWVYLYNDKDELLKTNNGKAGTVSCSEEVAYVTIAGSTKFHILYYDDATPICYQMPYFSTWLAHNDVG